MGKQNYLVSVFVDGKNVGSHYSEDLSELIAVKEKYQGCVIEIFDLMTFRYLSDCDVNRKVGKSVYDWKKAITSKHVDEVVAKPARPKTHTKKNMWQRKVLCVETNHVFRSIRECSEVTGIPYMTITNCIKNGNATRGLHFTNVMRTQ